MKQFFTLILFALLMMSCQDNAVGPSHIADANNKLTVQLNSSVYGWGESDFVEISGILTNTERVPYYSKLGLLFGPPPEVSLFVLESATGYFEKYFPERKVWEIVDSNYLSVEGTKFIQIQALKDYKLNARISTRGRGKITGTFRIRIDYYEEIDQYPNATPYRDYSDVFVIR